MAGAAALSVAKRAQLVGSISPGAISRKRKHQWLGRDEVLAHFRSKKAFAQWDEQVLIDYIEHGTHDDPAGQRLLSFDTMWKPASTTPCPTTWSAC